MENYDSIHWCITQLGNNSSLSQFTDPRVWSTQLPMYRGKGQQQEADVQWCMLPWFHPFAQRIGCQVRRSLWIWLANNMLITVICILCATLKKFKLNKAFLWWVTSRQRCGEHHEDTLPRETCCMQTPHPHHQSCLHCFDKPVWGEVRHDCDTCTSTRKES